MKRAIILCLLLLPLFSLAQDTLSYTIFLSKDSLPYNLEENWRYHVGDDPVMALPGYDDSQWPHGKTQLWQNTEKGRYDSIKGIVWFRLPFIINSSLAGKPLAFGIAHYGASEIYIDGKLVGKYGIIKGPDSTEYYDPQRFPLIFVIPDTGAHLLAVRYANYDGQKNNKKYSRQMAGFQMAISFANQASINNFSQVVALTTILMFLSGIFIALAMLHFILFLYYKSSRSNLYFSMFCFCLALAFFLPFLSRITASPHVDLTCTYLTFVIMGLTCFSFSGFINELFSKNKLRFAIVAIACLVVIVLGFLDRSMAIIGGFALITAVALEGVVIIVIALYHKVPGARIIGTGILFFTLFILGLFGCAIAMNGFQINDSTTTGQIVELLMCAAILSMPVSMSAYLAWSFSGFHRNLELKKQLEQQHEELKAEKKKSDDLLLNILPAEVAEELKEKGTTQAKLFDHVTVLFTDFVDFTQAGENMLPQELVNELHTCFKTFDDIISRYNIEKIKTIGDAYLAVAGIPVADPMHAENVIRAAIEIERFMAERKARLDKKSFNIRIGIHSGSVVAGIVGVKKFAYDIWGDTVNTAARMEAHSEAGRINISESTYALVKDHFVCTYRGEIEAKNKGALKMYFVEGQVGG